nr:hypothetical protein [Rhodococcus sp. (in: high G+C Gram-positive bacteria)]
MTSALQSRSNYVTGSLGRVGRITHNREDYVTIQTASEIVDRDRQTVTKWITAGVLKEYRITGRSVRWVKESDLHAAVEEMANRKTGRAAPIPDDIRAVMVNRNLTAREASIITGRSEWSVNHARRQEAEASR